MGMSYQLRQLFITLLLFCGVSYPLKLFREHASHMSEDFNYRITRKSSSGNSLSIENYLTSSLLLELEKLLKDDGYSLSHFSLPVPDHIGTASLDNKLILYELSYDSHILTSSIENDIPKLNSSQNQVFEDLHLCIQQLWSNIFHL
jgi:hypothetical protein